MQAAPVGSSSAASSSRSSSGAHNANALGESFAQQPALAPSSASSTSSSRPQGPLQLPPPLVIDRHDAESGASAKSGFASKMKSHYANEFARVRALRAAAIAKNDGDDGDGGGGDSEGGPHSGSSGGDIDMSG